MNLLSFLCLYMRKEITSYLILSRTKNELRLRGLEGFLLLTEKYPSALYKLARFYAPVVASGGTML